jgi:dihydroorotase
MAALLLLLSLNLVAADYDVVISNGRVMNPASGLDSVRNVGVRDGRIATLSREPISGDIEVDATGLVVAPGFIDLHAHGQREFEATLQARDGVTTQLDMELGAYPVDAWYEDRAKAAPINYGATVSHILSRQATMVDLAALGLTEKDLVGGINAPAFKIVSTQRTWMEDAASDEQIEEIKQRVQQGIDQGSLGIGYGINYTAGATREEIIRLFELSRKNGVTNFVHSRFMSEHNLGGSVDAVQELLANAAITSASLHIVHIGSSGGSQVRLLLEMIDGARDNGMDVTTEVYPYTAWSTFIGAAIFDGDFTTALGLGYGDIELPENGERLNEERFHQLRREMPSTIIVGHGMQETNVTAAVAHPGVMIASDGMFYNEGRAHPRGAGTYARVLGHYVREKNALSLMDALGKMSYLPARRLENVVPQMKTKGRISEGADADIVVFDPATVIDRATFNDPAQPSKGIEHVLVNGAFVVKDGELRKGVYPGKAVRR